MNKLDTRLMEARTAPVVAGVDGTQGSFAAVRWAVTEAVAREAPLWLAHIYEPTTVPDRQDMRRAADFALSVLREQRVHTDITIATTMKHGGVVPGLAAVTRDAALLVVATRGIGRPLAGLGDSTAAAMVEHTHCPMVVVPRGEMGGEMGDVGSVVLGAPSVLDRASTEFAFDHAAREGAKLVAVHAFSDGTAARADLTLAEQLDPWTRAYPNVSVRREIQVGQPVTALLAASRHARLLVLSSRGVSGLPGLLAGSVSQAVIYQADCPVAIVR